jgi:acetyl-CoA C-acetyltransferase
VTDVVIVSAKRTPIGKFNGQFVDVPAADLGALSVRAALQACGVRPEQVGEVIFGNARQAGNGPNLARQVLHKAGIPISTPAFTVNKACASSLKAITLACQAIVLGDAEIVVAGGAENMSRTPFILDQMRAGYRLGHSKVLDAMYRDGFLCPLCGQLMGETAENLAEEYSISREEQDGFALESQRRCHEAISSGRMKEEIAPAEVETKKGPITLSTDEHPRPTTLEELAKLQPVFRKSGTVTPGNACGIADAAAAVVAMSADRARSMGIRPLARIVGYTQVGVEPRIMGIGPVEAVRSLERRIGLKLDQFDLVELNEAFAVQVLACRRDLKLDLSRTNVNGGAIALGHPIGATGARIVVTLLHEMARRKAGRGLATLCVSGGLGMALALESIHG